jgi:hypothetical protein
VTKMLVYSIDFTRAANINVRNFNRTKDHITNLRILRLCNTGALFWGVKLRSHAPLCNSHYLFLFRKNLSTSILPITPAP